MGFFDFARDLGRQVLDSDSDDAKKIKEFVATRTSGIENLDVKYDDGTVTLCGDCVNQATKDYAVLMVGNIKGVEKVVADELTVPPPAPEEPEEKAEFYTIEKGDTLGAIAKRYYGKATDYQRIFEANKDIIEDADKIYPGQKIRIPLD